MKITIETIPHDLQRIRGQVGDWEFIGENVLIRVSATGNWGYDSAIAIHELVEALLCRAEEISPAEVDAFDMTYDGEEREPGDDPAAPYRQQHCFATAVERLLIAAFGMSWAEYSKAVDEL